MPPDMYVYRIFRGGNRDGKRAENAKQQKISAKIFLLHSVLFLSFLLGAFFSFCLQSWFSDLNNFLSILL